MPFSVYVVSQIQAFTDELGDSAPQAEAPSASNPTAGTVQMETTLQMHDPAFQAGKLGFKVGAFIRRKKSIHDTFSAGAPKKKTKEPM